MSKSIQKEEIAADLLFLLLVISKIYLFANLVKRLLSRAALFLWIKPFEAALSKARTASKCNLETSSLLSLSTAFLNFLTAVLNLLNSEALRLLVAFCVLTRLIADLICGMKFTSNDLEIYFIHYT